MIEIVGKYNTAKVMVPNESDLEDYARAQIKMICDTKDIGSHIVLMPDVHPGKVGPIGLTMDITDTKYIMPALLGPDIGCGMSIVKLSKVKKDFEKLDTVIRENIPSGSAKHTKYEKRDDRLYLNTGRCSDEFSEYMGTLGGGNHFIELGQDDRGDYYLTVHSGSRGLGHYVYEWYMREGQKVHKANGEDIPYEMTRLSGELAQNYIEDTYKCNEFAMINRHTIINTIIKKMKWNKESMIIDKPHNFIVEEFLPINYCNDSLLDMSEILNDLKEKRTILRKGAIDAKFHTAVIPVNCRDGILLGTVKEVPAWNLSAPHGSGRIIKRSEVKDSYTVSEYKKVMKENGIYSTSITKDTLDEAPFAYRDLKYMREALKDLELKQISVDGLRLIKPVYNFKGGD